MCGGFNYVAVEKTDYYSFMFFDFLRLHVKDCIVLWGSG